MLSRRRFVAAVTWGLGGLGWPRSTAAAAGRNELSSSQRRWLLAVLPQQDQRYDSFAKMLASSAPGGPAQQFPLGSRDVHSTRSSLAYAAALRDTGVDWRIERANEILRRVISLQDQDPESQTYGTWPWCLEEPLAKMSPPDGASADFCGVLLLTAWMGHREELGISLADGVRDSILHSARSTQWRNVSPEDTTRAILGAGVTLLAAQAFKLPDLRTQAKDRLRRFHDYVMQQGSLAEYNSPLDTIVALQELSRMRLLVIDARDRAWITALHELAWKHAATHFHPPTRQWAGPHSRTLDTDLGKQPATLAFLATAGWEKVSFDLPDPPPLSLEAYRLPLQCPRKWVKHVEQLDAPRQVVETFVQADPARAGSKNPIAGTTWLHPRFALGSINRGDFWRQRRPLLAYWGTPPAPRHLRVRFLKNGADFASALLFTAQQESAVLAVVVFATDYGDTHPTLDPIQEATIQAKDLRLRFEVGGDLTGFTIKTAGEAEKYLLLQDPKVLRPLADSFGGTPLRWDLPQLSLVDRIDAVAYAGEEQALNLSGLNEAFICFTLEEWPYQQKLPARASVELDRSGGRLRARWSTRGKELELEAPIKPGPYPVLNDLFRSRVMS
ncbi:MAG: hypothetical protein DME25_17505 [Verrucomicrobia bacterium]|nr:MAG: hypothetical protein DME25_17505 [Verrucomicrobiota bacterium]